MEKIEIRDGKENITVYIDGHELSGYRFHPDNTYEPVDKSVLKYFEMFELSNNRTPLENEGKYQVILDKTTNFKHYFLDGVEDFKMFFMNNGEDATVYLDGEENQNGKKSEFKRFSFGKVVITLLLTTCLTILPIKQDVYASTMKYLDEKKFEDITVGDIIDYINVTPYLAADVKEFLVANRGNGIFYDEVLKESNTSSYIKYELRDRLKDLEIVTYKQKEHPTWAGFYLHDNKIYISEDVYNSPNVDYRNQVILHEFMHLWQQDYSLKVLTEATAEKISGEIINGPVSYPNSRQVTKSLVQIIGTYPVWHYVFTGDFSLIEEKVRPYLTPEDYEKFMNCLHEADNVDNIVELYRIIDILAEKYGIEFAPKEEIYYLAKLAPPKDILANVSESLADGKITISKYDWRGNKVGTATYEDLKSDYYYSNGKYCYALEGKFEKRKAFFYGNNHLEAGDINEFNEDKMISFDEFAAKYGSQLEEWTSDVDLSKDIPESDKRHFDYPDGSTVDILDDFTVIRREKDGKTEVIKLSPNVSMHVYNNGYILWQLDRKRVSGACRMIFPDGTMMKKYVLEPENYFKDGYSPTKCVFSTGEELYCNSGLVYSCAVANDETIQPLNGWLASFDWLDANGNKLGEKVFTADTIAWYDNDNNKAMYVNHLDSADEFRTYDYSDGKNDVIYANGVVEHRDLEFNSYGYTYPNGRSVLIDGEHKCIVTDENGEIFDIGVSEEECSYINDFVPGIHIYCDNENGTTDHIYIYVGKYLLKYDDDWNLISTTELNAKENNLSGMIN